MQAYLIYAMLVGKKARRSELKKNPQSHKYQESGPAGGTGGNCNEPWLSHRVLYLRAWLL